MTQGQVNLWKVKADNESLFVFKAFCLNIIILQQEK